MSPVQDIWRQLVQRRLWPVAVLLLAGLAAVPLTLATQPDPVEPVPTAAVRGDDELATQPIVALAAAEDRAKRRRVLGTPKNPFATPEPVDTTLATDTATATVVAPTAVSPAQASSGSSSPSGTSPGGTSPGGAYSPTPVTPGASGPGSYGATTEKRYAMLEPTVRFGEVSGEPVRTTLKRLAPMPSPEAPVLLNLGVVKDGKTAVFLLGRGVTAVGDGTCEPTPEQCYTTRLKAGETELFQVADEAGNVIAHYRLDVIQIHKRMVATSAKANARSKAGLRLIRARVVTGGATGYRWNPEIVALERRSSARLAHRSVSLLP